VTRAVTLAIVLLSARCSSPGAPELPALLAERREQFNEALDSQDAFRVEVEGATLARLARERFVELLAGLSSSDPEMQEAAAFALGFSRHRGAIDPLAAATESERPALRAVAIASLGMLGFREVPLEPFRKRLGDDDPHVRLSALFGLRHLAGPGCPTPVLEAVHARLSDSSMGIRNEAVLVLGKIGGAVSIEMLLAGPIRDPEALVRQNVARALGTLRGPGERIVPALKGLLKDEDPGVVRAAQTSLRWIEGGHVDTPRPDR
jgi:HEAT repeat protein